MKFQKGVMSTQAKGCWFCLHVGSWAFYIGSGNVGHRLELFTPVRIYRFSRGGKYNRDTIKRDCVPDYKRL